MGCTAMFVYKHLLNVGVPTWVCVHLTELGGTRLGSWLHSPHTHTLARLDPGCALSEHHFLTHAYP